MKKYFKLMLLLGLSIILITGCMNELVIPENDLNSTVLEGNSINENFSGDLVTETGGLGTGKGILKIYLTDAPGAYEEVNINISRIEGHIADEDGEGEWVALFNPGSFEVDLLTLQDVSILLSTSELLPNKYTQIRIFLNDAWVVVESETHYLEIPSSANTGIKLNRPFEIKENMITELTIDFDAEKSIIRTGSGKYKMKPVIHTISKMYPLNEIAGSVSGNVSLYESIEGALTLTGIEGADIELSGGAYIFVNTTTTSSDGSFILANVPAGSYTLNVYADGFDDYSESVEVLAGANSEVNVVFSSGGITGVVKEEGSDPTIFINGATVTVDLTGGETFNSSGITDENGGFLIEPLPVGFYILTVSASGYEPYETDTGEEVQVTAGNITNIGEIELTFNP